MLVFLKKRMLVTPQNVIKKKYIQINFNYKK